MGSSLPAAAQDGSPVAPAVPDSTVPTDPCLTAEPTLVGTDSDDLLVGTDGDDVIFGLEGNDTIEGGLGNDVLCGGPGDDSLVGNEGSDSISGGDGNDVIGGGMGDDLILGGAGADVVEGKRGADTIFGQLGDDNLAGNEDNDFVAGGPGADLLGGGQDDDVILGGEGDDTIDGKRGADLLFGEAGDDEIVGSQDPDIIVGGVGNDTIGGGKGDDELFGQSGNDQLAGKAGDDFLDGGLDVDTLDGDGGSDVCDDGESNIQCETVTTNGEPPETVLCLGLEATIVGSDADDELVGTDGDDVIVGLGGDDIIYAFAGDDIVCAGEGNDTIFGAAGSDTIDGEGGNDTVLGGDGSDGLSGGAGIDTCSDPDVVDISTAEGCEDDVIETPDDSAVLDAVTPSLNEPSTPADVGLTFSAGSPASVDHVTTAIDYSALNVDTTGLVSVPYDFTLPEGVSFDTAELTLPYFPDAVVGLDETQVRIHVFNEEYQLWVPVSGAQSVDVDANTVTATLAHFSTYAVRAAFPGFPAGGVDQETAIAIERALECVSDGGPAVSSAEFALDADDVLYGPQLLGNKILTVDRDGSLTEYEISAQSAAVSGSEDLEVARVEKVESSNSLSVFFVENTAGGYSVIVRSAGGTRWSVAAPTGLEFRRSPTQVTVLDGNRFAINAFQAGVMSIVVYDLAGPVLNRSWQSSVIPLPDSYFQEPPASPNTRTSLGSMALSGNYLWVVGGALDEPAEAVERFDLSSADPAASRTRIESRNDATVFASGDYVGVTSADPPTDFDIYASDASFVQTIPRPSVADFVWRSAMDSSVGSNRLMVADSDSTIWETDLGSDGQPIPGNSLLELQQISAPGFPFGLSGHNGATLVTMQDGFGFASPRTFHYITKTDLQVDSDEDGLTDCEETNGVLLASGLFDAEPGIELFTTDPNDPESEPEGEEDGLMDGEELVKLALADNPEIDAAYGFLRDEYGIEHVYVLRGDPLRFDADTDGLSDFEEVRTYGTDPNDWDSDNDLVGDNVEVTIGFDANDPANPNNGLIEAPPLTPGGFFSAPGVLGEGVSPLDGFTPTAEFEITITDMNEQGGLTEIVDVFPVGFGRIIDFDPSTTRCAREACPEIWDAGEQLIGTAQTVCDAIGIGTGLFNALFPGGECESLDGWVERFAKIYIDDQGLFEHDGRIREDIAQELFLIYCTEDLEETDACTNNFAAEAINDPVTVQELVDAIEVLATISPGAILRGRDFESKQRMKLGANASPTIRPVTGDDLDPLWNEYMGGRSLIPRLRGLFRGTAPDAVVGRNNFYEFKAGTSTLSASYQLRLQMFLALQRNGSWTLVTTRPITQSLRDLIDSDSRLRLVQNSLPCP